MKNLRKMIPVATAIIALLSLFSAFPVAPVHAAGLCPEGTLETMTNTASDASGNEIQYIVEVECFIVGATPGTPATATYYISYSSASALSDFGSVGTYEPNSKHPCNKPGTCSVAAPSFVQTEGTPLTGSELELLDGSATLTSYPTQGKNTVAHLGEIIINLPSGFFTADGASSFEADFSIVWHPA